ncbi:unnamed protein product [Symbiodinium sp. CCMP2592]|nr:unnamed protein product [Symbiodinium sp. CCMP2592]
MSAAAREAAITMALTPTVEGQDPVWKLGVRVYPHLSVAKSYRQMMLLIHPDKNDSSTRSSEATKVLLAVWEKFVSWNPALRKSSAKLCRLRAMNSFEKDLRDALQKAGPGLFERPVRPAWAFDAFDGFDAPRQAPAGSSSSSAPPASHHEAGALLLPDLSTGCTSQDTGFMDHEARFCAWNRDPDMHGESPFGSAPADLHFEGCWLRWEAVSVAGLDRALALDGTRRADAFDMFEELYWLRQRAVRIRGKVGYVPVLEREGQGPPGLRPRIYSGIGKLPALPEQDGKRKKNQDELEAAVAKRDEAISKLPKELQRELAAHVPEHFVGRSAFSCGRLTRCMARQGLDALEIDVVNSFYQWLAKVVMVGEDCPFLSSYVQDRESWLAQLEEGFRACPDCPKPVPRCDLKRLLISIGFGGSFANWSSRTLSAVFDETDIPEVARIHGLEGEVRRAHRLIWRNLPEESRAWLEGGSGGRVAFFAYADWERKVLQSMAAAAGASLLALEHDGVCALSEAKDRVLQAAADLGVRVAAKPVPNAVECAAAEHPDFDWKLEAKLPYGDYQKLRQRCKDNVRRGRARPNNGDFADLLVAMLEPIIYVPNQPHEKTDTYEYFGPDCVWVEAKKEHLGYLSRSCLKRLYGNRETPPEPLNDLGFANSLTQAVLAGLSGRLQKPLNGDHSRGKILLADGIIADFETGEIRRALPRDRMSLKAAATSKKWKPPIDTAFFEHVEAFLETGASELEENEEGRRVIADLESLHQHSGWLRMLKNYGSWDQVLYLLRLHSRALSGYARICELLWMYGCGSSGKDVIYLPLMTFLGHESFNYGAILPGQFVTACRAAEAHAATPFQDQLQGKRGVWASEIPAHDNLNEGFLKGYCEQEGAPIAGRALNRGPRSWRPQGLLFCTSNHAPRVQDSEDDGWTRRARVWETQHRFVANPTGPCERKGDDTLKGRIQSGAFNSELLYFAMGLYGSLKERYNPGTMLLPMPVEMRDIQAELARSNPQRTASDFVESCCEIVQVYQEGTPWSTIKEVCREFLGYGPSETSKVNMALTRANIKRHAACSKNIALGPRGALRLKPEFATRDPFAPIL